MTRPIIVSAADSAFYSLLTDLLDSLDAVGIGPDIDCGVVDLGLTATESAALTARGVILAAPRTNIFLPQAFPFKQSSMGVLVRPAYPEIFPHHDPIMHMDADVWVQSRAAVDRYIEGARTGKLVITPQTDSCYDQSRDAVRWRQERLTDYFGRQSAKRTILLPYYNAGIFALPRNSVIWREFATVFQAALMTSRRGFVSDQTVLNHIIHHHQAHVLPLPATHNWMTHLAAPMLDVERAVLVAPRLPYETLDIIHLTATNKLAPRQLAIRGGGHAETALTRRAVQEWFTARRPGRPVERIISL